jgi:anti-sigma factor RsiW
MLCSRAQNLLSAYADYELPGGEMLRVRQHVDRCPACSRELASIQQVKRLLGALPEVEAPPFAAERVAEMPARPRLPRLAARWWAALTMPLTGWRQSASYLAVGSVCGVALALMVAVPGSQPQEAGGARMPLEFPIEDSVRPLPTPGPLPAFGVQPVGAERVYLTPRGGYQYPGQWPPYPPAGPSPEFNGR